MDQKQATCFQHVQNGGDNWWLSRDAVDQRRALVLCRQCPVRIECALDAREFGPSIGVWGGIVFGGHVLEEDGRGQHKRTVDE